MKLETFFEKFELFADAPDAVAKMRELVLRLALDGRLIGSDSIKWKRVKLGSLGEWGSGGTPLRSEPRYYGGKAPWLVIGDLNDGIVTSPSTFITEEGLANSSARMLPKGVLLIAMYGSIGKLGITGIECATNQAIAFCKPDAEQVDLRHLFHTVKAIQPELLRRGQGLAQKNISQTILKAWETSPVTCRAKADRGEGGRVDGLVRSAGSAAAGTRDAAGRARPRVAGPLRRSAHPGQ